MQFKMLGFILILVSLSLSLTANNLYLLLFVVALGLASITDGIQIDFKERKHRDYFGFLGLKFGKWHHLPEIGYVVVFGQRMTQGMNMVSISSSNTIDDFKTSLISKDNIPIDAGLYKKKETAIRNATELAGELSVELRINFEC